MSGTHLALTWDYSLRLVPEMVWPGIVLLSVGGWHVLRLERPEDCLDRSTARDLLALSPSFGVNEVSRYRRVFAAFESVSSFHSLTYWISRVPQVKVSHTLKYQRKPTSYRFMKASCSTSSFPESTLSILLPYCEHSYDLIYVF